MRAAFAITTGTPVTDFARFVGVPLTVALLAFAASVCTAAVSFALSRCGDSTARRREGYAAATRELVAWAEYPYRIRRRTSDDSAVLAALADLGHTLQEALRYRQTWIRSEDRWVGAIFEEVRAALARTLGPACNDAWSLPPIQTPAQMTMNGWGPVGVGELIDRFERATTFRFGWRRVIGAIGLHPGTRRIYEDGDIQH